MNKKQKLTRYFMILLTLFTMLSCKLWESDKTDNGQGTPFPTLEPYLFED